MQGELAEHQLFQVWRQIAQLGRQMVRLWRQIAQRHGAALYSGI
jgi:hypothetical protein